MVDNAGGVVGLRERLADVRKKVDSAVRRSNRDSREITLIAVSKTHPPEVIRQAALAGVDDFGENRVQEAESKKFEARVEGVRWHLIGHLQANKARRAVRLFDVIHTLDSTSLAQRLERLCAEEGKERLPVLIQVALGDEETKSGAAENDIPEIVDAVSDGSRLELRGLMTLPPFFPDPEQVRPYFRRLRELRDQLSVSGAFQNRSGELSMGMSHDFRVAIEEGATMLRIGTAIFGERIS